MKIEGCKTVPEFFGVNIHDHIWVEGKRFKVYRDALGGEQSAPNEASRALVGCLTGQLKWSRHEPMTAEEENILREIAEWQNNWEALGLTNNGTIYAISKVDKYYADIPFGNKDKGSKAYEVLAPILEKYGEIGLDDYRGNDNERD